MIVWINNIRWHITFVEPFNECLLRTSGEYSLGVTDTITKNVYISCVLDKATMDRVICHEIVHCFAYSYGVLVDIETEELLADFIARYGRKIIEKTDRILSKHL